ncbi:MAG: phosphotransferase family protein [Gammaproteobacteria bacterium]|uniref:Phosphotransferase family protein n=1 Tax=OM182 bacterium TaxID=2510334 RepID=A0A520RY52_9GAMM|nr:phosphotransferase family protein [Gammaproteobacteria bacterium]RZO75173.1 MAG: phosphotransferase family protein [OM182 bacterium]
MTEMNPEGYKLKAVEAWVKDHVQSLSPPFTWTHLPGGHSNLTYQIEDRKGKLAVIRRPPRGELLPKAHDMSREWALISALFDTDVPVPEPLGFCEDPSITGAWFYIMGFVSGNPLYNADDVHNLVPETNRKRLANSFIDKLAALHSLNPDEIGLGELGKKEGYIARQVKTWYRSWMSSIEPAQLDDSRAHDLQKFFLDNIPDQELARVVHGDYGFHNTLVGQDGTITAIVDWEISTLGDPLADLAYALMPWQTSDISIPRNPEAVTAQFGFPSREYLAERYEKTTSRNLSQLNFYIAFNRWKSAAIVHGVYARYMANQKSADGVDLIKMHSDIIGNLEESERIVDSLP